MLATEVEEMPRDEAKWAEVRQHSIEAGERFREYLGQLMADRGITIEELYERFDETGWRIPIPGRHALIGVPFEEFKLHAARAYASPDEPWTYLHFVRGMEEALELDEEEGRLFVWYYVLGVLGAARVATVGKPRGPGYPYTRSPGPSSCPIHERPRCSRVFGSSPKKFQKSLIWVIRQSPPRCYATSVTTYGAECLLCAPPHKGKVKKMRRRAILLSVMIGALLLTTVAGVAWAKTFTCEPGTTKDNPCKGTKRGDQITGTIGPDYILAKAGKDTVSALAGDDDLLGASGNDTLLGGDGADNLYGGSGADSLDGGPNATTSSRPEILCPGTGSDTLTESTGPDGYVFQGSWGRDTISGSGDASSIFDTASWDSIVFSNGGNETLCGTSVSAGLVINLVTGQAFVATAGPSGANAVTWNPNSTVIEAVVGGRGNDNITGAGGINNSVNGADGADLINVADVVASVGAADLVDCGANDGDTDTVIKDSIDQTQNCASDTVSNAP